MIGTRLAHYEVVGHLGSGGMGDVYEARDSKLGRHVAIKFLPESVANDAERVARFEREARVLAALNHPNIAAIYGLEHAADRHFLVMELVTGRTLEQMIESVRGRGLGLDVVRPITRQIIDALDAAHEQGIVHRDLKPANIKVKDDGTVKVLDFGLAKGLENTAAATPASGETRAGRGGEQTTSPAMTQLGTILGTAAYMAPEQASGRPVDKRADIWAFGVVVWEMLTGRRLFDGETTSHVLAAVLTKDPDLTVVPSSLRSLVGRCLEKNSTKRLRDIADARWEIEHETPAVADARPSGRGWIAWIGAAAFALLAIAGWLRSEPGRAPSPSNVLTIVPSPDEPLIPVGNLTSAPVISPDGAAVLYHATGGLYIRRLDALEPTRVPGSENWTNAAFWSADSSAILFPTVDRLLRVQLPDGAPETVSSLPQPTRGGTVNADGDMIVAPASGPPLVRLAAGGELKTVPIPGLPDGGIRYPEFLPDGRDVLFFFTRGRAEPGRIYVATFKGGAFSNVSLLMTNDTAASYTPADGGRLLFVRNDNLYSRGIDLAKRVVEGDEALVAAGVASQPGGGIERGDFSVAGNGTVVWRPGKAARAQVTTLDRRGHQIGASGPPASVTSVVLAPDERRLLVPGEPAWILDAGQPGHMPLPGDGFWMVWTADGAGLVGEDRQGSIVERSVDGLGPAREVGRLPATLGYQTTISPDRRFIVGVEGAKIGYAAMTGTDAERTPQDLVEAGGPVRNISFAPDGTWIVYAIMNGGLAVHAFPGAGRTRQIAATGDHPIWRGDGREIIYADGAAIWSVSVSASGGDLTFGPPTRLFDWRPPPGLNASERPLAVSRDGSRFFLVQGVDPGDTGVIEVKTGLGVRHAGGR